jgi:hypothetical protein
MIDGRQCDSAGKGCSELPGKRLYPGAEWSIELKPGHRADYMVRSPDESGRKTF